MHAVTEPADVNVAPGEPGFVAVTVTNTSSVIDAYDVGVFGLDRRWVEVSPAELTLFPGETGTAEVTVRVPDDQPAARRTLAVNVVSRADPSEFLLKDVCFEIGTTEATSLTVDPVVVNGGRSATFGIVVTNEGNAMVRRAAVAFDPEGTALFEFSRREVIVPPGGEQVIQVTARGGRAWFGQPRARTYTFAIVPPEQILLPPAQTERVEAIGTFIQRPRIARGLISLAGLLAAALVFAVVLNLTVWKPINNATVDLKALEQTLVRSDPGGARIPANPWTIEGIVKSLSTEEGLAGIQAELYVATATSEPIRTAATGSSGEFVLPDLNVGAYKLRLSGAGIEPQWYPDALTPANAVDIQVGVAPTDGSVSTSDFDRRATSIDEIKVAGAPVEVGGRIDVGETGDLDDVTLRLVVPGRIDPTLDALVEDVRLAPDGSFSFAGVPSPGNYRLVVEKPGATSVVRDIEVAPGTPVSGLEVSLAAGTGLITGTVTTPGNVPIGGAMVTATSGDVVVETVTLTEGSGIHPKGSFALRNLSLPGQYTVTIGKPGFQPETRTVSLAPVDPNSDSQAQGSQGRSYSFTSVLSPAVGTVSGSVTVGGVVERGLKVHLTGPDVERSTSVVSQGPTAGTYSLAGLPVPGSYTLTFDGAGTVEQVREVAIGPTATVQGDVNVSLVRTSTIVSGTVFNTAVNPPRPEGQATVELSNASTVRTFRSADDPAGAYEFSGVPPGSYTLKASRGSATVADVRVVTVTSGNPIIGFDLFLGPAASVSGRVLGLKPGQTVEVRLYTPDSFGVQGGAPPVDRAFTDAAGNYTLDEALDAPETYVLAVYRDSGQITGLDSQLVTTQPGEAIRATDFTVSVE